MSQIAAQVASFFELTEFETHVVEQCADEVFASAAARDAFREQVRGRREDGSAKPADLLSTGIALFVLGQYAEAIDVLGKATDGKYRRFYSAQSALALGRLDHAIDAFREAASKGWDALEADMKIAAAQIRKGDLPAAQKLVKKHESTGPDRGEWWFLRGLVAERADDREAAIESYRRALQLVPGHVEAMFRLAWLLDVCGEDDRAIELYAELAERPRAHVHALVNLAVLYEDCGRYSEAAACLRRVLATFPNHTRARLFLRDVESSRSMVIDEAHERRSESRHKLLDTPISEFELSVRARNCLRKMNINTLGELIKLTEPELLSYKNFGETSLKEIKALLSKRGLHLGQAPEDVEAALAAAEAAVVAAPVRAPAPTGNEALLSKPVSELELSVRARRCLQRLNISTLHDLVQHSEADLLATRNFGQTSLSEIKARLADHGLALAPKR